MSSPLPTKSKFGYLKREKCPVTLKRFCCEILALPFLSIKCELISISCRVLGLQKLSDFSEVCLYVELALQI